MSERDPALDAMVFTLEGRFGIPQCTLCEQGPMTDDAPIVHLPWCRHALALVQLLRGVDYTRLDDIIEERRSASFPDEPDAPFADRLLLALALHPRFVDDLGEDTLVAAAATVRTHAHRMSFIAQDWAMERTFRTDMLAALRRIVTLSKAARPSAGGDALDEIRRIAGEAVASFDDFEGV